MASKPASNDNQAAVREAECRDGATAAAEVATLDFAGQFVVWSLRNWVKALKGDLDFNRVTEGTFGRFGLTKSAAALDRMMALLAAKASRRIDIRCVPCRYLSPDELIMLDAVAAAQQNGFFLATVGLRKLVPGTAARCMLPLLVDLARDLHAAGLRVAPVTAAMTAQAEAIAGQVIGAQRAAVLH